MALPDPVTREEMYLSKAATGAGELPTPVTRKEMFLNGLATGTKSGLTPITREEMFLDAIEPGGGGDITLETLNVSENGTKNAPSGTAYNKVNVSVPVPTLDTLTATDNGTYTPQSGHAYDEVVVNVPKGITPSGTKQITENGTFDVTQFASAEVNVPTGGGGAAVASGTVTLAARGNIVIPHNLDTTKVICLISPTGTIKATQGYTHMSLVAANLSAIFSDLDNVVYDFTSYASSNYPDPYHRNGPYPAGSGLKSPWSSHPPSQWDALTGSSWAANTAWPVSSGVELIVTFNQNSVEATGFAIGTYNWKVVAL